MRRGLRLLVPTVLLLMAAVLLVRRTVRLRDESVDVVPSRDPWTPIMEPESVPEPAPDPEWVEAVDGACPSTHPVKAKAASGIYHLPGMANYQRTRPDRCYAEESAAQADGYTRAKR